MVSLGRSLQDSEKLFNRTNRCVFVKFVQNASFASKVSQSVYQPINYLAHELTFTIILPIYCLKPIPFSDVKN